MNWCFWTVVLEKTLESPLDCKEIQPVTSKGDQSWVFIGRTDAEAETPILWSPDAKSWLTGKDPDAGKDWRQEKKGMTEDDVVRWHHWLDGQAWASSRSWWWTGKPGMLESMGLQRVRNDWVTELNFRAINGHCPQERSWRGFTDKNSKTQLTFKKSIAKVNSSYPLIQKQNRWPQDKMLSIPNYYRRDANQDDNKKSNPSDRISWVSTNSNWGREPGDDASPVHVPWEWTSVTAPRKDSPLDWKIFSRK